MRQREKKNGRAKIKDLNRVWSKNERKFSIDRDGMHTGPVVENSNSHVAIANKQIKPDQKFTVTYGCRHELCT